MSVLLYFLFVICPLLSGVIFAINYIKKTKKNQISSFNKKFEISNLNQISKNMNINYINKGYKQVLFLSVDCGSCNEIVDKMIASNLRLNEYVFIIDGSRENCEKWVEINEISENVFYLNNKSFYEEYLIIELPYLFIVNEGLIKHKMPMYTSLLIDNEV